MMNIIEVIVHHLKQLLMPTVRRCYEQIEALVKSSEPVPVVTEVRIPAVDLTFYDQLLVEVAS